MSFKYEDVRDVALKIAKGDIPTNFSKEDLTVTFVNEISKLIPAGDFNAYRRNNLTLFELIQEVVDEVLPNKVQDAFMPFAEVKQYRQGQKATFKKKAGRTRAKGFITKVGLAGIYETFRLDSTTFDVTTTAYGGAASIELEEILDGRVDFAELTDIIMTGLEDAVYKEVRDALYSAITTLPTANQITHAGFDKTKMVNAITIARAYGGNANIFCTPQFAATITPDTNFISDADKADMRNQGYIGKYMGANVILLPQSFEDATNAKLSVDPRTAFIIPTAGSADEKIVKVAIEGQTIVDEVKNADQSREIQAYKKFGVSVIPCNYIVAYTNSALATTGWGA